MSVNAALDATFLWWLSPCKKYKILLDSFQRNWWLKNIATCFSQSILCHNWRTRFVVDISVEPDFFFQNHKDHCYAPFLGEKDTHGLIFGKMQKTLFWRNIWVFPPKWEYFWQIRLCQFLPLKTQYLQGIQGLVATF